MWALQDKFDVPINSKPLSWPEALAAMNACICAYQIRRVTTAPGEQAQILRSETRGDGDRAFVYDVMPDFQDAAGFRVASETYTPEFEACGADDIDAETGFATAVMHLWPWIEWELASRIASLSGGLVITGHSKGGAMTFVVASLVRAKWPYLPIVVYAFAPPVAGNSGFARAFDASGLTQVTHRIQVTCDAVPYLPRWDRADIWEALKPSGVLERVGWDLLARLAHDLTGKGYSAVGNVIVVRDSHGTVSYGIDAVGASLTAVAAALEAKDYEAVASAHSSVSSYLRKIKTATNKAE
ncbi:MAG: hypothetical protein AAGD43_27190 [Pseudomonadota bacterium]